MASIVLSAVGSAVFSSAATSIGASAVWASAAAAVGSSIFGYVGSQIDNAILGVGDSSSRSSSGVVDVSQNLSSSYGQPIPIAYGTVRVGGNVVWMSDIRLDITENRRKVKTGKFSSSTVTESVDRDVTVDLAVALLSVPSIIDESLAVNESGEDEILITRTRQAAVGLRRIWIANELKYDGRTFNSDAQVDGFEFDKFYDGLESQQPEDYIESIEGIGEVPAFRGIAYVFIKNMDLIPYGERIPNMQFEVVSSLPRMFMEDGIEGMCEHSDGTIFAVSHLKRTITRFNPETLESISTIGRNSGNEDDYLGDLKAHPWRCAIDSNSNYVYVTHRGDAALSKIDTLDNSVESSLDLDYYPNDIMVDNSGKIWVTHPTKNKVSRINSSMTIEANYTISGAPHSITTDDEGNIWVTTITNVIKLNPSDGTEILNISTGHFFLWGIDYNYTSEEIWVTVPGEGIILVYNKSGTLVTRRNTGTYPTHIHSNQNDQYGSIAVTNMYGNQLKVYSTDKKELISYGTVAFPGPVYHMQNGKVIISQTRYNFAMIADGR